MKIKILVDKIGGKVPRFYHSTQEDFHTPIQFKFYDDDGEHYFTGVGASYEDVETFFDYAMRTWGVTYSETREAHNKPFTPFIG